MIKFHLLTHLGGNLAEVLGGGRRKHTATEKKVIDSKAAQLSCTVVFPSVLLV